ncbi:MAG: diguanylate cyclase [Burkholderiales bacterium]|nr:diguanylate cyclase [Burkholderiales bacterium]
MNSQTEQESLALIAHALPPEILVHALDRSLGANVSLVDRDLRFHYANGGFAKSFGTTPEALIGKTLRDFYNPTHFAAFEGYVNRALAGETVTYERRSQVVDSDGIWFTVSLTPWRNADGAVIGIISCSMKVHELKLSSEALRVANERLSSHMDNSPLTVLELDASLTITRCSNRVSVLLGLAPGALEGRALLDALHIADANEPLVSALSRLTSGAEESNRVESNLTHADGHTVYCEWFNSALTDASGRVTSIMALVQDVSARVEAAQQLLHIATHDTLTGLANRRMLTERLSHALARAERTGEAVAVLFIDLDGFKSVNDKHGHGAGDEVLRDVATRLRRIARATDFVARLGGDEFVILLDTDVHPGSPSMLAERVFDALSAPCRFTGGEAPIGASIGVAMHPPLSNLAADLIRRADAAMYEAKSAGKGCVRYAMA